MGDILAEGVKRASEKSAKGSERYAMHIRGMEIEEPPAILKGYGFSIAISTRGAWHLKRTATTELLLSPDDGERLYGVPTAGNPKTFEGKTKLSIYFERLKAIVDSCNVCYFLSEWASPLRLPRMNDYRNLIEAATGWKITLEDLIVAADRIHNVARMRVPKMVKNGIYSF